MVSLATVTDARPAVPPLVSLLTTVPVGTLGAHEANGITYDGETCSVSATGAGVCAINQTLPSTDANEAGVEGVPYLVYDTDACSTFTMRSRDGRARATRFLAASEHESIERELWEGTVAQANAYPTPYLRKSTATVIGSIAFKPKMALALLERALGASRTRPVIHASILGAYFLPEVRLDGQAWVTKKQTLVVPGAGYTGTGPIGNANATPAATETWLYGTGMVDVRRGPVFTTPDDDVQAIDRDVNLAVFRAQRFAVATFDPCLHFAIRMTFATDEDAPAIA